MINFNPSLLLCYANTASVVWNIFCSKFSSLQCIVNSIKQAIYIESVGFTSFFQLGAFYDTFSLQEACQIFIICKLSECNHTEWKPSRSPRRIRKSASIRTTTSNRLDKWVNQSLIKGKSKSFIDSEGHWWDAHTAPWPSHDVPFTLQHSFLPTHLCSKKMQRMLSHSRLLAKFNLSHDFAKFTLSICASAFTLPLLCLIFAADLTKTRCEAHLHCHIHTTRFTQRQVFGL